MSVLKDQPCERFGVFEYCVRSDRQRTANLYAPKFGDLDAPSFSNGITGAEAFAFYIYTTGLAYYQYINEQLWSEAPSPAVKQFASVLDGALKKLPPYTGNNGTVYRGYNALDLEGFRKRYLPGGQVWFPAFTSASFKRETAFGGNVLFIIRAHSARVIWFLAADYLEEEVLLPTGCTFTVVDVLAENERLVVILQEIR